ncbi:MAG: 30S ribosomal protein S1 [Pseudomonadota bacterium]
MSNTSGNLLDTPLSDLDRDAFKSLFESALQESNVQEHSVVTGNVIDIGDEFVTVDIGFKAEGIIPRREFMSPEGELTIAIGDKVDVYLDNLDQGDGQLYLSKERADLMKAWEEISKAVERDEVVSGTIVARVKGGVQVDIGVKAFLPGSQVDLRPVKNLDKLLGETYEFKIIKFNKKRGNIVLSRRVLLEQERESKRSDTLAKLQVGSIMQGVIKNITDYGAFVDLGGIDGLLHITDMSYGRINHPSEMFEIGQTIEVKVLKFDRDTQRVSLGYKQIRPDPWEEVEYKYPVGAIVRGKVVSIPDYGAFIELEDGIEGLVHISEMTWNKRIKHPTKILNLGDVVEAKVLGVDVDNKRISLGMRQLEPNPWDMVEEKYPVGTIVHGKVRNITDFGIFVGIEDGIDGLVHISDLSWGQRIKHPTDKFHKGDEVEARVLNIDKENERFSLGIRQLSEDPWLSVQARYFLGQIVQGKLVHKVDFGVFVEIEEGIEGLVHISELSRGGDDWIEHYQLNQQVVAEIINIDSHDRKISLSERGAEERNVDSSSMSDFIARQGESSTRLGDVMGDLSRKLSESVGDEQE